MRAEKEFIVPFIVTVIAILVIVGGYASFSGLATYDTPISVEMGKAAFQQGEVFDVNAIVSPMTLLADETLMVYVDGNLAGVVALKKYLDDNRIDYGLEYKNLGQNNVQIMNMQSSLRINLADLVSLESLARGEHILSVELSRGDARAEATFNIE
jgi:hypothetical protein